jgi:DNA polymerase III delta prime subunit
LQKGYGIGNLPLVTLAATLAMVDSAGLKALLNRLETGKRLSKQDLQILVTAVRSQQVTIATGDRAVAIGGSADGAAIVTGDRNVVITGADAEAIRELAGTRPRNERLLLQAVKEEVSSRLKQSLHNQVFIQLGMEAQPELVLSPLEVDIKIGRRPPEAILESMSIGDVFDKPEIAGKLLILGNPGAGKTTTMLELSKVLCERAEQQIDFPIPVLMNLSSWRDDQQSMRDWLVAELDSKYGVRNDIGEKWVADRIMLPILDGLDELEPVRQAPCVQKINEWVQGEARPQYCVVCSRLKEYEYYKSKSSLKLNGAVYLKELSNEQIQGYLETVKCAELWQLLSGNLDLLNLIRTPFILSVAVLTYPQSQGQEWQKLQGADDQLRYLLDAYVARMLNCRSDEQFKGFPYTSEQTQQWLIWLSQKIEDDFLVDEIQPSLLTSYQLKSYRLISVLLCGLTGALFIGLIPRLMFVNNPIINLGPFFGLLCGLFFGQRLVQNKTQDLILSGIRKSALKIKVIMLLVIIIWSLLGLVSGLIFEPFFGIISAIIIAVFSTWLSRLKREEIEIRVHSNQGIRSSLATTILMAILSVVLAVAARMLLPLLPNYTFLIITIPTISSLSLFMAGGQECIQHFSLRLVLRDKGSIPCNYTRFLDYCTDRLLLQRIGGRYRFIHRLLQEHFAAMLLEKE